MAVYASIGIHHCADLVCDTYYPGNSEQITLRIEVTNPYTKDMGSFELTLYDLPAEVRQNLLGAFPPKRTVDDKSQPTP